MPKTNLDKLVANDYRKEWLILFNEKFATNKKLREALELLEEETTTWAEFNMNVHEAAKILKEILK